MNRKIQPKVNFDDNEKTASSICRKLINHEDSKFLIAPLSQKECLFCLKTPYTLIQKDNNDFISPSVYLLAVFDEPPTSVSSKTFKELVARSKI